MLGRLYAHLRHRLRIPDDQRIAAIVAKRQQDDLASIRAAVAQLTQQSRRDTLAVVKQLKQVDAAISAQARSAQVLSSLSRRVQQLRTELVSDRLVLRRADARLGRMLAAPPVEHGAPAEMDAPAAEAEPYPERPPVQPAAATVDAEWMCLDICPGCESATRGPVVCEFNRFLVHGNAPEPDFHVYNYTLCPQCGLVYAARRPRGERYRRMLHTFTESLGRMSPGSNLLLNAMPLSEHDRQEIDRRAGRGVFVSEHEGVNRSDFLPALQRDRLAMAPHVELLGSLLTLEGARVLEIRSRTGALLEALRRLYGAEVMAMPIFESQQHVLRRVYDIPADTLIDFEDFTIPYDGLFDVIVSNHMVTHALHPLRALRRIREQMKDGGHLYLYNEPDEAECLDLKQSMFKILNPFHMQTFNRETLLRLLARAGFEPVYVSHSDAVYLTCLARATAPQTPPPVAESEWDRRKVAYARARDIAILQAPETVRPMFGDEWQQALERASVAGLVDMDDRGRLRFSH